jgi:hypothetical protein
MIFHPYRTGRQLAKEPRIRYAFWLVFSVSAITALLTFRSYLAGEYPPSPEMLALWIKTWGEFAMVPFIKIPMESYRLFTTLIEIPIAITIWMLAAGTARLLTRLFGEKLDFDQFLNLLAFTIFPFWFISGLMDGAYQLILKPHQFAALSGQLGSLTQGLYTWYPQIMYPVVQGLGALFLGFAIHANEGLRVWKTALIAFFAFTWVIIATMVFSR